MYFDALGAPWPKHPCIESSGLHEIPSSLYWKAYEYDQGPLKKRLVDLATKNFGAVVAGGEKWFKLVIDKIYRSSLRSNNFGPVVSLWILELPPDTFGKVNFEFNKLNKKIVVGLATSIVESFGDRRPNGVKKICLQLAEEVLSYARAKRDAVKSPDATEERRSK